MNRRILSVLVVLLASIPLLFALSCSQNEVSVRTGLIIECRYGHVIKDTTRYVKVPAERAKDYKVSEEVTTCAAHLRAQRLYGQAQKALAAGKKTKAKSLFGAVAVIDPKFKDVSAKYKSLGGKVPAGSAAATSSVASKSASDGKNGGNKTGPGQQQGTGYLARLPKSVSRYKQVSQSEDMLSGTRLFAGTGSSKVRLLTVNVEWIGKKTNFAAWYKQILAPKFSSQKNWRLSLPGADRGAVRFGTDGGKLCNLCWARGGLVYQAELEIKTSASSAFQSEAVRVAELCP